MRLKRYILTSPNRRPLTQTDLHYLKRHTTVLDQSRCTVLVEDTASHLRRFLQSLPGWNCQPESLYNLCKPLKTAFGLPS